MTDTGICLRHVAYVSLRLLVHVGNEIIRQTTRRRFYVNVPSRRSPLRNSGTRIRQTRILARPVEAGFLFEKGRRFPRYRKGNSPAKISRKI